MPLTAKTDWEITLLSSLLTLTPGTLVLDFSADRRIMYVLTTPLGAHMIGRAACLVRVPLWEGTRIDELKDRHDEPESRSASNDSPGSREPP